MPSSTSSSQHQRSTSTTRSSRTPPARTSQHQQWLHVHARQQHQHPRPPATPARVCRHPADTTRTPLADEPPKSMVTHNQHQHQPCPTSTTHADHEHQQPTHPPTSFGSSSDPASPPRAITHPPAAAPYQHDPRPPAAPAAAVPNEQPGHNHQQQVCTHLFPSSTTRSSRAQPVRAPQHQHCVRIHAHQQHPRPPATPAGSRNRLAPPATTAPHQQRCLPRVACSAVLLECYEVV